MNGKQLKNSILQWAIHGKLVPQDASEEPAIELLKRVNPKIKPITEDVPFEIPESWAWVKLGEIVKKISSGKNKKKGIDGGFMVYGSTGIIGRTNIPIYNYKQLLVARVGANAGYVHIADGEYDVSDNTLMVDIRGEYNFKYMYYMLNSMRLNQYVKGGAQPLITGSLLKGLLFPLPPLAEQKRIVAKIEELMPLVERYTKAQEGLDKLNAGIKVKLRASILQEAIQGKLVPQDANYEPAIKLLKRINPKFKPVECEGELPEGWSVATLSTLCTLIDGEKIQGKEMVNLDAKYLRGKSGGTILTSGRYIPSNSLVILVDGENSGEVFRTPVEGYQGSTFKHLTINENMFDDYVLWVINSHRIKLREHKVGSAIPHLNKKLFRETLVLVPPLAEQKRIVAKIEALFGVLGRL